MSVREAIRRASALLSRRDRRLLFASIGVQMSTSLLDLLGVVLIGLVGAIAVTTVQSQPPPVSVTMITDRLGLADLSDQGLVLVLAASAAVVLLTKSIVSSILLRRVFLFLAHRQALVSARLSRELLSRPLTFVQQRSTQQTAFALITGAGAATVAILGQLVVAATEAALLVVIGVGLLIISPWVAIGAIAFFGLVAFGLQRAMGGWASRVGRTAAAAEVASLNAVQEALSAYREVTVASRRPYYVHRIQGLRWTAARVNADTLFIGMFPKYMFEAALVVGGFALSAVLFATQDSAAAVGTLALFLAAGTRVMPSLLRLQGAALGLRSSAGVAGPTFELAEALEHPLEVPDPIEASALIRERISVGNPDFKPDIELDSVSFSYPGATKPALRNVDLVVRPGQAVAFVGSSGAGKSTLADVILGVVEPSDGRALLGGAPPSQATSTWPGAVGYVPQDVVLANDTVRANVALGLPPDAIDDAMVWEALERAHIADYLRANREGLDTLIGERGVRISGGQRQRLGIARALYTRPRLLVLDEATSALDAETEQLVTQMIGELAGDVTTIVIAHRLSTVRRVDFLVYLDEGTIVSTGTFEELARDVPAFAHQTHLMGLGS